MKHEDRAHAKLAPSKMKMHMNCRASLIPLEHPVPDVPSKYALEGTQAHELMEYTLNNRLSRFGKMNSVNYGVEYSKEMQEYIDPLADRIDKIIAYIGDENIYKILIEERVKFSENIYGTLDFAILYIKDGERRAYILDLKYGKGTAVPALGNEQLGTYLLALLRTEEWDAQQATIVIYQPRNSDISDKPFDQWTVDQGGIKLFERTLVNFEKGALKILQSHVAGKPYDAPETVGDWCKFCPRKAICRTFATTNSVPGLLVLDRAEPLEVIALEAAPDKKGKRKKITKAPEPKDLSDEQLSAILKQADMIRDFLKSVEIYAAGRYFSDNKLPGWKLVEGRRSRRWLENEDEIADKLRKLGVKDPWNMKLKGIGEIEKQIGKGEADEFTTFNTPKPKLVEETDSRPAITNRDLSLLTELNADEESSYNN